VISRFIVFKQITRQVTQSCYYRRALINRCSVFFETYRFFGQIGLIEFLKWIKVEVFFKPHRGITHLVMFLGIIEGVYVFFHNIHLKK
jgi:hypothetical protein